MELDEKETPAWIQTGPMYLLLPVTGQKYMICSETSTTEQPGIKQLKGGLGILRPTLFPGERYNPNQFFITEDGLYLSTNNDKNPELREDVLSFKLFEVEGIN